MTDEEAIRFAMQGKIIRCCGECVYYNKHKHKCQLGHYKESNPRDRFFDDCGLEDIEKHDAEVRKEAIDECLESIGRILHDKLHCFEDECDEPMSCDRCLYESIKKSLERIKEQNK